MLSWLKKIGTTSTNWRNSSYPLEELGWLEKDFKPLDSLKAGVCERIMEFVVCGDGIVPAEVARLPGASPTLSLRCRQNNYGKDVRPRDDFFVSTTILDPAFHLRLALVYDSIASFHAATLKDRMEVAPGLKGGAEFLDAYLWEALRVDANVYPRKPSPSKLSAVEMEKILELHGNPTSWLVRGALVIDVTKWGYGGNSSGIIPAVTGFHDSLVRHLGMVRECLDQSDPRAKTHAIEVLLKAKFSPVHCPDAAAQLAVSTAKGVREVAEAWIMLDPTAVLPEMKRIAVDAGPTERFQAVKWLHKHGGEAGRAFLADRVPAEKSAKVLELIEGCLNPQAQADVAAAPESAALPPLPAVPDLFAEQTLDATVLEDLRAVVAKANAEWQREWEKQQGQKWAPKEPTQFPDGTAEEWFTLLQTLQSGIQPQHTVKGGRFHPRPCLIEFAAHPKFKLVHVTRWAAILNRDLFNKGHVWFGAGTQCFEAWMHKHGPIDYRHLAAICEKLRFQTDWIARLWFGVSGWAGSAFVQQTGDLVWPYFAERMSLLEKALGWTPSDEDFMSKHMESIFKANAWRALATFPVPPPSFLDRMWEVALGSAQNERALAQAALKHAPNRESRLTAALASGQQEQRGIAADWIGRLGLTALIPALRSAIAKEKHDTPKATMIGSLERLGVPPDEFLNRVALLNDTRKVTAKPPPASMAWFQLAQLPVVHWGDNGAAVEPEILHAWLIQACKLKLAEPNALVRRYAASFVPEERETLGQFILDAWMAEDVMPHPRPLAEQNAMASAQSFFQSAQQYPQYYPNYVGKTVDQLYASILPGCLEIPRGSANDSKGLLAIAAACVGAGAAQPVARYLKKWYGTRVHQARALLQMLAWVDHPSATQTLLAVGTRFRTKSLQEEATKLAQAIAERKGWSLAELADRTIPSVGLDDEGVLALDFGPRQFAARLDAQMNLVLFDPEGKSIKALPDPRKDDDAEKAAVAKKQLTATRKELKQVLDQQRINFYEAMCVQRTWRFEDWEPFLCLHPIVRHFCQRLVWNAQLGEQVLHFRPLADGTFTDVEDNPLTLEPADVISLAHQSTVPTEMAKAWLQHLSDYEIAPLFDQFGRSAPEMTPETKKQRELKDFEGWMSDTFKIRGRATKLGYTRGSTGDGGWFNEYIKRFPTTGLVAVIEFTGSSLPETQIPAALTKLTFRRDNGTQSSPDLPLSEVPSVLLTECWNDYRQIAAEGTGYDPEWEKKGLM
ncbi:MAG: DUF4132 domain-containing protein [Prosthecobacter sp.]|nr:DUF4132 domain-containing protein [Prosthecobacter sp.]